MKNPEYVDTVWLLHANRAEARRLGCRKAALYAVTALVILLIFLCAAFWARSQAIGTNLPLAPYSVDEASGEVMK